MLGSTEQDFSFNIDGQQMKNCDDIDLLGVNIGRGRTNAFGVYIGHKICHRVPATSATLLSRPDITMPEEPKDQKSRCPASKQVISCPKALK